MSLCGLWLASSLNKPTLAKLQNQHLSTRIPEHLSRDKNSQVYLHIHIQYISTRHVANFSLSNVFPFWTWQKQAYSSWLVCVLSQQKVPSSIGGAITINTRKWRTDRGRG